MINHFVTAPFIFILFLSIPHKKRTHQESFFPIFSYLYLSFSFSTSIIAL